MKTAFSFAPEQVVSSYFYKDLQLTEAKRKEYYQFLLNYRLNPTFIYSFNPSPPFEDWPWCIEHGANALCIRYVDFIKKDSIQAIKRFKEMVKTETCYLKLHGLLKYAYYYGFDEVTPRNYRKVRNVKEYMRGVDSSVPLACTVVPNLGLKGYVNTWVPLTQNFNEKDCEERQKAGDEVWWYVCNFPITKGYPNFFIEYPAIDPRILFWQTSKYKLSGFLYYSIDNWQNNTYGKNYPNPDNPNIEALKKGFRWPDIPWVSFSYMRFNGDGQLIYPGKNQKIMAFCSPH